MANPLEHIILCELGEQKVDLEAILRAAGLPREEVARRLEPLVEFGPDWETGHVRLSAGQVIGTVQIAGLRVEVRPRLAASEAVTMIRYALGGKVDPTLRASLPATASMGLDDLVCQVLADEADRIRRVGLSRQYRMQHEHLSALRGRPDFLGSFPWDDERATSLACTYHLLTCDNLDNQLLRATLEQSSLLDVSLGLRSRLLAHRAAWKTSTSPIWPTREHFAKARAGYTRFSEHYRLAHNMGEMVITRRRPTDLFRDGAHQTGGLTLSMPALFEKFVERLLTELFATRGMTVESQAPDQGALLDGKGCLYRRVRPDLVVFEGRKPVMVVDAKYKEYWLGETAGAVPARKVSNTDIYQLFFYAQRLQLRFGLAVPPAACIVAPLPAADERNGRAEIDGRYKRIVWRAGNEQAGDVHLANLPLTDILRCMENHRDWRDRLGLVTADFDLIARP